MRFCHDLDRALTERGFAITVSTSDQIDARRRAAARELLDGIEIVRFANPSNHLAGRLPWLWYHPIGLRRALVEHARRCDVIHLAEARGPHVSWALAAGRASGVPVVWSPFGGLAEGAGLRGPYRRAYDVVHRTRRLVAAADALVAQTPHEARLLERLGARAGQVRIIGLGVDGRRFRELPPRGTFRRAIGIDPSRPLVLFIGRFHPTKGLDVLLRAAAIARRAIPDLTVVLVGWDQGSLGMVKRLTRRLHLEDAVRIVPPMFEGASIQAYVDADVFAVAATVHEETSLAAMEALAAGTPCVLTCQCEVPDLEAMGGGRVTECHAEGVAAALCAVLADPCRAARARAAREVILRTQTVGQRADAYAELFREVVADHGAMPRARDLAVQ